MKIIQRGKCKPHLRRTDKNVIKGSMVETGENVICVPS